jgi:hypothetical protein
VHVVLDAAGFDWLHGIVEGKYLTSPHYAAILPNYVGMVAAVRSAFQSAASAASVDVA